MLYQTDTAKGYHQIAQPRDANALNTVRLYMPLVSHGLLTTDKLELGFLPMHCRIRSALLIPAGFGAAIAVTVGLMSGEPGDPDDARTVGNELFDAEAVNASAVEMTALTGFNLTPTSTNRAIGLTVGTSIAAGVGKGVTLLMDYYQ